MKFINKPGAAIRRDEERKGTEDRWNGISVHAHYVTSHDTLDGLLYLPTFTGTDRLQGF